MIKTVRIRNPAGNILELDLRSSVDDHGLVIFNMSGLGPAKATVNGQGGPNFDGVRVSSTRVDARHITMTLAVSEHITSLEETAKDKIYTFFPIKQQIIFGIETDSKDVYTAGIIESNEFNQFAKVENAVISIYCPNPYFIDTEEIVVTISADGAIPLFEFPFSNESLSDPLMQFGYITDLPTGFIDYYGEVETGADIILEFLGAATDIVITNTNGAQQMTIDLSTVGPTQNYDQIFINTRVGEKSIYFVRNQVWTNMINDVGIDDDWIQLRPGNNTVIINAATGVDNINTEVRYRPLREGV